MYKTKIVKRLQKKQQQKHVATLLTSMLHFDKKNMEHHKAIAETKTSTTNATITVIKSDIIVTSLQKTMAKI